MTQTGPHPCAGHPAHLGPPSVGTHPSPARLLEGRWGYLNWGSARFQRSQRRAHKRGLGRRPPGRGQEAWTPSERAQERGLGRRPPGRGQEAWTPSERAQRGAWGAGRQEAWTPSERAGPGEGPGAPRGRRHGPRVSERAQDADVCFSYSSLSLPKKGTQNRP